MKAILVLFLITTGFTSGSFANEESGFTPRAGDLPNYIVVNPQLARSGRPSFAGLQSIKAHGFKTIINLEDNFGAVNLEKSQAESLGLIEISYPMKTQQTPNDQTINAILADLQNPNLQPILIHCFHGEDRTGLVMGLYRVFANHWTQQDAYNEMLQDGFHPRYQNLDAYFKTKTSTSP